MIIKKELITKVIVIDITDNLILLDKMLNKYVKLPDGLRFIHGRRDPVYDVSILNNLNKRKIFSRPLSPFLSAYVIKDCIDIMLYNSYPNTQELNYNIITNNSSKIYDVTDNYTYADVLNSMLAKNTHGDLIINYTNEDMAEMLRLIEDILGTINSNIGMFVDYIYSVDITSDKFIINRYITVKDYRYREVIGDKYV